jgi:nitrilase
VVAKASDGVGFIASRIDKTLVKKVRGMIPVAQHKVLGIEAPKKPARAA